MINDVIVEIRNLLETNMGSRCVAYYAGNLGIPARAQMPVCIVRRRATNMDERRSTTQDYYRFEISVLIVTDLIKSLGTAALTNGLIPSENTLANIIEERDTDNAPKTNTVLGVLTRQRNVRGTYYQYIKNIRVNYEPELNGQDMYVAAEVTFDVEDQLTRKS